MKRSNLCMQRTLLSALIISFSGFSATASAPYETAPVTTKTEQAVIVIAENDIAEDVEITKPKKKKKKKKKRYSQDSHGGSFRQ